MEKIKKAIELLPKSRPCFLLSFMPMDTNKQIAQLLKDRRPLCMVITPQEFPTPGAFTQLDDELKYDLKVDNHIIMHNTSPEHFIKNYGKIYNTKFTYIFVDRDYNGLSKMMLRDGRIIKL
jgi:hypothetical protein